MLFNNTFLTVSRPSEGIFRDKGSKFISYCYPISNEVEIKSIVAALRQEHPRANHFCWAIRLTPDRSVFKLADDGEPAGTAGRPILNVLLSADVTNVAVVVVRYFGGTLLGVPGLINAYKRAASEALAANDLVEKSVNDVYEVNFDYLATNQVMRIIKEEGLAILAQQFDTESRIEFEVSQSRLNLVLARFEKIEGVSLRYLRTIS